MMSSKLLKKTITLFLLLFFLFGGNIVYAFTITETATVGISARVGEDITITPGGSSGGGVILPHTAVSFSGYAYPNANVTLMKSGTVKATVQASASGAFSITLEEQYNNNILYSLFAEDVSGNRSLLINYPVAVQAGYVTQISGIRFAPTIVIDKSQVKEGDYLTVNGYALPQQDIDVTITGPQKKVFTLTSFNDGTYKIVLPLTELPEGAYSIFVNYKDDARISKLIRFSVGDTNVSFLETPSSIPGDCNADHTINIVDFSILAFWYGKPNPPKCVDINGDGIVNLVDFSILAFYWTG